MSEMANSGNVPILNSADRMLLALRHSDVGVQEMADYLEVSRNTVGSWINGRTRPSGAALRLFALRTGVPYQWIRTGNAPRLDGPDEGLKYTAWESNPEPTGSKHRLRAVADVVPLRRQAIGARPYRRGAAA